MDTPLLLIVWRRPNTIRQVINAIRPFAPTRLFVASDGPNPTRPEEAKKVLATREVIEHGIDWPCEIKRLYSDVNQGCSVGPIRAISWFFDQVTEGIILEDDCVPHPEFLSYCTVLLERYRYDTRVWCISGNNCQEGQWRGEGSYYFARIPLTWGWATWRRCWQEYDAKLLAWPRLRDSGYLNNIFHDKLERNYWSQKWQLTYELKEVSWWDYQWCLLCIGNGGLSIEPNHNLVKNVGFGEDATHTTGKEEDTSIGGGLGPLVHPPFILCHPEASRFTFENKFKEPAVKRYIQFISHITSKVRHYWGRLCSRIIH